MRNSLLKSVALSALLVGSSVAVPAVGYVSTAMAQDTTTPKTEKPATDSGAAGGADSNSMKSDDSSGGAMKADDNAMKSGDDAAKPADSAATPPATDDSSTATDSAAKADDGEKIVTEQQDSEILASTYIGQDVYNANDKSIGDISDLVFDEKGGIKAAVVGVGGFLGIGEKDVAVKFDRISIQRKSDSADVKLVTDMTADQLKKAPAFKNLQAKMDEQNANKAPAGGATGGSMGTGGAATGGAAGTGAGGTTSQ